MQGAPEPVWAPITSAPQFFRAADEAPALCALVTAPWWVR